MYRIFLLLISFNMGISTYAQIFDLRVQYNGNYSYTLFGNTLASGPNQVPGYCELLASSTATFSNPNNYPIKQATLYYAASGYGIEDVFLNDQQADFILKTTYAFPNEPNKSYFFAKADVTQILRNEGQTDYTFSGLEELNGSAIYDFCYEAKSAGGMCPINSDLFAGWTVLVIYEDPQLPFNSISVFDGYQFLGEYNLPTLDINTSDASNASLSFLSWEGDISGANEWILFNDIPLENDWNSYSNQMFNSTNSFTGERTWGMDLDTFELSELIDANTTEAVINFTSSGTCADGAILQLAVLEVENRLPNPGIEIIDAKPSVCGDAQVNISFRITNYNTTEILPAGVEINLYSAVQARPLIQTLYTSQSIAPLHSLEMETMVTIPDLTRSIAGVSIEVNKDLTGNTIFPELNPQDNEAEILIQDVGKPTLLMPTSFSPNGDGINDDFGLLNGERCKGNIEDFHLRIFHRYGQLVFETTDITTPWDGRGLDNISNQGVYLYIATYKSALTNRAYKKSGTVLLLR